MKEKKKEKTDNFVPNDICFHQGTVLTKCVGVTDTINNDRECKGMSTIIYMLGTKQKQTTQSTL